MIKKTVACSYSIYVHIIVFCRKNEVFGKLSYLFKKEGVFLATIIEQIIAIDSDAQKRLDEAASYKDVCEREIEQTTRALTEQKRKNAEAKQALLRRRAGERDPGAFFIALRRDGRLL